ncbi:hypothetical protein [Nocardia sp. NPDC019395]|uniref:hypothetical protein n=1 Tax=Nocardia sp. NPDC019395 TaxID=3154686 RepID=UPI0033D1C909
MTTLLEALVGEPLILQLLDQCHTTAAGLSDRIRLALGRSETDPVIIRRSVLTTGSGAVVSENSVVIVAQHRHATMLADEHRPMGHSMIASGQHLERVVLETGVTAWSFTDTANGNRCVYKESLLRDHVSDPVAHLYERMSPAFAPLTEAL